MRPAPTGFALFDTAIGPCGIVWGDAGVLGTALPEASPSATRSRLRRRYPSAAESTPPPEAQEAIAAIQILLRGEPVDLVGIALDMEGIDAFARRVYDVARGIAPGQTLSYGEIARRLDAPNSAREVGRALGANPFPIVVPCHRVLAAGGKAGGFSANGGTRTKLRLLEIEGAALGGDPGLFD